MPAIQLDPLVVKRRLDALSGWVRSNGLAGYDPYDLLEPRWVRNCLYSRSATVQWAAAKPLSAVLRYAPGPCRRLLRAKKRVNAKAVGLLAGGYLRIFEASADANAKQEATEMLQWLVANPSQGYHGLSWGYPFDWQSRVLIPKGMPSSVVSATAGDAFWTAYRCLGDRRSLEACVQICEFFLNDLNRTPGAAGTFCFSYTPVDRFQVHNANLFVAEFLARVGSEIGDGTLVDAGSRAADFSVAQQHLDGSLDYWAAEQNAQPPNTNDHYHVGFEIRSLYGLWKATAEARYLDAARRYHAYYLQRLIVTDGDDMKPMMTPRGFYPVDIHSCSEAIILNVALSEELPQAAAVLPGLYRWIVRTMSSRDGGFYYRVYRPLGIPIVDRSPYLRWGQAWMFLALSSLLVALTARVPAAVRNATWNEGSCRCARLS